jgi:hypothetical protein
MKSSKRRILCENYKITKSLKDQIES